MNYYQEDLAYVHDSGFGEFAINATSMILKTLGEQFPNKGLVIDLGCGSGIVAKSLTQAGFNVLGIDHSNAMIGLAKHKAPKAEFITGSFFDIDLPKCSAIISTSECFNYITHVTDNENALKNLFQKSFNALEEGGLLIFDMIEPGTADDNKYIIEKEEDWTMFVHVFEDKDKNILTREVTLFRKIGDNYRKSKEVHQAKLYKHESIITFLQEVGFCVDLFKQYNDLVLDEHHFGYLCKK